jgi:hypothetical protein
LAYSIPPLRLKERGVAGVLAYGLCCSVSYVGVPWAWLGSGWHLLALLGSAVFMDRWVNLHFHQVLDFEADRRRRCLTYAVRSGLVRTRRTLRWAAYAAFVAMFGVLSFLAFAVRPFGAIAAAAAGATAVAAGLYASGARSRSQDGSALVRELPSAYLGMTYALFWIAPPLLLVRLSLLEPAIWTLAGMALLSTILSSAHSVRYQYD